MNPMIDPTAPLRPNVFCPHCGFRLFDGLVIKARIIRVFPKGAEAKCRCKAWVEVPIAYFAMKAGQTAHLPQKNVAKSL